MRASLPATVLEPAINVLAMNMNPGPWKAAAKGAPHDATFWVDSRYGNHGVLVANLGARSENDSAWLDLGVLAPPFILSA